MDKLSNTKYTINSTIKSLQSMLRDDLTTRELEYIEFMLKQIAISAVHDTRNSMNEILNGIEDINK